MEIASIASLPTLFTLMVIFTFIVLSMRFESDTEDPSGKPPVDGGPES